MDKILKKYPKGVVPDQPLNGHGREMGRTRIYSGRQIKSSRYKQKINKIMDNIYDE